MGWKFDGQDPRRLVRNVTPGIMPGDELPPDFHERAERVTVAPLPMFEHYKETMMGRDRSRKVTKPKKQ